MRWSKAVKTLFKLSWKVCPYLFFSTFVSSVLVIALKMTYVFMPKLILDSLIAFEDWNHVLALIAIFVGIIATIKIFDLFSRPWRNTCTNRAGIDTVNHYMGLAARTKYSVFEKADYRDKLETAMSQVRGPVAVDFCVQNISSLFSLVVFSAFIATINPWIILIIWVSVFLNAVVKNRLNVLEEKTLHGFKKNARGFKYLNQTFSSFKFAKEMRVNDADRLIDQKYNDNIEERWKLDTYYEKKHFAISLIKHLANGIEIILLYGYAAYAVINGAMSIGSFTAFVASAHGVSEVLSKIIDSWQDINLRVKFVPLYCEIMEFAQDSEIQGDTLLADSDQFEIKFENVSFVYPDTQKEVLHNINLTISPGCKLAIVGENGSGKTTLIKLLCRLYSPTSGKITINGTDINEISMTAYTQLLSVVFQDYKLFSFHVADNIVLNSSFSDEKLRDVIQKTDLEEKINGLDSGVETFINKEFDSKGVEFSGGEAQKLVLARAYYKGSPIVILDEPTASLDPLAEQYLYNHFRSIIDHRSAIFISQRLASTFFCDHIVVFSAGRIAEEGTHEELLALGGLYSNMWNLQVQLYAKKEAQ